LTSDSSSSQQSQVDFYLLADSQLSADHLACRLAMMAWEHQQAVFVVANSDSHIKKLDELMWQYPPDRFLPHSTANSDGAEKAPVSIGKSVDLKTAGVVINLCIDAIEQPDKFNRILEIVPFAEQERQASRTKFKTYRDLGLSPQLHEINT
jgi:DNA polymerase-3 subunit chi